LNIIKSQHIFWAGILPYYVLDLHCALFEVLRYFCVNNQGLLRSLGERGPNPGSCRLTHAVKQVHAEKENTACLFSLQILVSTSYRIHSSVGGKVVFICLKVTVVLWGLNHRTRGFELGFMSAAGKKERSITYTVSIHLHCDPCESRGAQYRFRTRESGLLPLKTTCISNRC